MSILSTIIAAALAAAVGFIAGKKFFSSAGSPATVSATTHKSRRESSDLLGLSEDTGFAAQQLVWGMNQYRKSLTHLNELAENISQNTETNAARLEEMTASIQEIAKSANDVLAASKSSAKACNSTTELARQHHNNISNMAALMNKVTDIMEKAVGDIRRLNESSDQIGSFVIKIRNIASQTNLLALNAAIEAARAGENGRGFAVVAEEIRKLAVESEASTKEIETIVKNIIGNTANVTKNMENGNDNIKLAESQAVSAASAMSDFITDIQNIEKTIDNLCELSDSQRSTTDAVAQAIETISTATLHIAASASESSAQFRSQQKNIAELFNHAENVRVAAEKLQSVAAEEKQANELIFGINPFVAPEIIKKNYLPILNAVTAKIGCKARIVIVSDYDALGSSIASGKADIGWFSPFAYVSARNKTDLVPLATPKVNNSTSYEGYIITHRNRQINSLDELKGKRFGFVDKKSASGYIYPTALLASHGKTPDTFFSDTLFLGSHNQVIEAVLNGTIDAGATYSEAFAEAAKSGLNTNDIQIIARTEPIPKDVIAARSAIGDDKIQALIEAFSQLSDTKAEYSFLKQAHINSFVKTSDENYNVVRQAARLAN